MDAGVDIFVIRGTTVSAEHVSGRAEPLNLKQFIYELDVPVIVGGCATYTAALHLMRTGAAGVLVGFGGGAAHTTRTCWASRCRWPRRSPTSPPPAATTWTSPAAGTCTSSPTAAWARSGDIAKAIACGADAVMMGSRWPGPPTRPAAATTGGMEAHHPSCRAASGCSVGTVGTLEEILLGPAAAPTAR